MKTSWITAAALVLMAAGAWADAGGPGVWRVHGVAADDVLNARMGPGTDYAVIATFAPGERGLRQVTCVPLLPRATWMQMTPEQRSALPQPWCLMRSRNSGRTGWVARRYLEEDADAASGDANTAASAPPLQETAKPGGTPTCSGTHVAAAGSMRYEKARTDLARTNRERFLQAKGFAPVEQWPGAASARGEEFHSEERFPDVGKSATLPDARLAAITRAMLEFDFEEGTVKHPRYLVTYHVAGTPPGAECDVLETAYIQITRFNLGGERYKDAIQGVDKALWPPKEIFGTQPHVSWRLVSSPAKYMGYTTVGASRRVLSDAQARAMDCLGAPCLSSDEPRGPVADKHTIPAGNWQPRQPGAYEPATFREPGYDWAPGPARMADLMYLEATGSPGNMTPSEGTSLERPEITLVITRDMWPDSAARGLLRRRGLMDHVFAEHWLRLSILPDPHFSWEQRDVRWRPH